MNETCTSCGRSFPAVELDITQDGFRCRDCDRAAAAAAGQNPLELEIGAFLGPAIRRARLLLWVAGIIFVVSGTISFQAMRARHEALMRDASNNVFGLVSAEEVRARVAAVERVVPLFFWLFGMSIAVGLGNIALSFVARRRSTLAFAVAIGLFVVHSAAFAWLLEPITLLSEVRIALALVLGAGVWAARKADRLRAQAAAPAPATAA